MEYALPMPIHGSSRTRLTNKIEWLLVELGGADPNKALGRDELSQALVRAIDELDVGDPALLDILADRIFAQLDTQERERLTRLEESQLGKA